LALYPDLISKTRKWAKSENRWFRRAAAVSLIVPVRDGLLLKEVFRTADILLTDDDDMVQKGYGWMLKEAGNVFPDEVFAYVMKHKAVMPRTALRYAIEKYPPAKRKQAMKKD
jgi:3-methyladenine DNA glycosylase AlkD